MSNADRNRALHKTHEHGNYHNYYAHRAEDTRLSLLPSFVGQTVLDLGCNAGAISFEAVRLGAITVLGLDIDEKLIEDAKRLNPSEKCEFLVSDFMSGSMEYFEDLYSTRTRPDTILLLSITKWLHLHQGDAGLIRLFTQLYNLLPIGGALVIEPQEWENYKKAVKKNKDLRPVFLTLAMRPDRIDFMKVRKVPLKKFVYASENASVDEADVLAASFREIVLTDRDLFERGTKAFVSFVRAYSKHEASYIFRVKDLDLISLAKSFGLLKIPRMPEIKTGEDRWKEVTVDWDNYAYTDKIREKQRQAELAVVRPSFDARSTKRSAIPLAALRNREDDSEGSDFDSEPEEVTEPLVLPPAKKFKSTKPIQTAAWSNKADAAARKELRRIKKMKKVKAVNGMIVRERETMGGDVEEGGDWKEALKEEKEKRKAEKSKKAAPKKVLEGVFDL